MVTTSANPQSPCVLVAGGSGIIGQAICREFAERRWHVGLHYYHNHESANQTSQAIRDTGVSASLYQADVQDHTQIQQMIGLFLAQQKQLDVLIWSIGISESQLLIRTTPYSWDTQLTTNLTGCFKLLHAVAPIFKQQQYGSVIIVGSLSGILGTRGQAAYAASKAGLIGLMKSVAKEWAPWNVRVNAIFPGWHASALSANAFPNMDDLDNHLLKTTPTIGDVAKSIYNLAIMEGISGQVWNLDSRIW